jgi:ElaB/YqjD/DUF883 family membrane-anchored ribosome-binding protein
MDSEVFPNTRKDAAGLKDTAVEAAKDLRDTAATHLDKAKGQVENLKSTAVDAAKDLRSTAAGHLEKARGQVRELGTHAKAEGAEHLHQVRGQVEDLTDAARTYISARPLAAVGVALAIGFILGARRRR